MAESVVAFAPGRANLIGEHTDYSDGLALPFAIDAGVTVAAVPRQGDDVVARALDLGEEDRFALAGGPPAHTGDWRDFVRGTAAELRETGLPAQGVELTIEGTVRAGAGLGSSAALGVALCLALLAVSGAPEQPDRIELARLCSRVENRWVGARTGLLDQLSALFGEPGRALLIDFRTLDVRPVPLELGGWALVAVDSGERHSLAAAAGYNERRSECERASELLGLTSLRDASAERLGELPEPLDRRVRHVVEENERVQATVRALERGDLTEVGRLLDASHASLRDLYDSSTAAVEVTVARLKASGAAGARMTGGGFGGHVLALYPPDAALPPGAFALLPAAGARVERTSREE